MRSSLRTGVFLLLSHVLWPTSVQPQAAHDARDSDYKLERLRKLQAFVCEELAANDEEGRKLQTYNRAKLQVLALDLSTQLDKQVAHLKELGPETLGSRTKAQLISRIENQRAFLEGFKKPDGDCQPMPGEGMVETAMVDPPGKPDSIHPTALTSFVPTLAAIKKTDSAKDSSSGAAAQGAASFQTKPAETKDEGSSGQGQKAEQPNVSISPQTVDFGSVPLGNASEEKTLTLTNLSDKPLEFLEIKPSDEKNFRVTENQCDSVLPAKGSNCKVKVVFTPFSLKVPEALVLAINTADSPNLKAARSDAKAAHAKALQATAYYSATKFRSENADRELQLRLKEQPEADAAQLNQKAQELAKALKVAADAKATADSEDKVAATKKEGEEEAAAAVAPSVQMTGVVEHWKYPLTRAVVGLDVSAASSRSLAPRGFIEFDLTAPLRPCHFRWGSCSKNEDPLEDRLWFFLNPRVATVPQTGSVSSALNVAGDFFDSNSKTKLSDIVQGLDVNAGLEIALIKPRSGIPWWAEYPNTRAKLSPSLVFGIGTLTPLANDKAPQTFKINQSILSAYCVPIDPTKPAASTNCATSLSGMSSPGAGSITNVAFFTQDRSRFFRKFYVGMRFKTHFFSHDAVADCYPKPNSERTAIFNATGENPCEAPYNIFPGILDVTMGKDEAINGGMFGKWIFRLDAVYPLPFIPGFHIYGSVYSSLAKNRLTNPITLETTTGATDTNTFRQLVTPLNRDFYRLGLGLDLIQVLKRKQPDQPNPDSPKAKQDNPAQAPASGSDQKGTQDGATKKKNTQDSPTK